MPPRILTRPEHTVSRKDIDADALKVLYRLKNHGFVAYMVGGGVRDLLLGRKPKDFDIGTSAHPQQVKKLFRNCFIIGRRFRLCHVRFGKKVVEVSTFRRQAEPEEGETLIRRDNTFGTPEEDAFRRDFTVNALFYDIANFSVIDYVDGLEDLRQRVIRTIGDPGVRLREDPVRMVRAVALAARLGFSIDRDTVEAIRALRGEILRSSAAAAPRGVLQDPAAGRVAAHVRASPRGGAAVAPSPRGRPGHRLGGEPLLGSLSRLDGYRNAGLAAPEDLSNAVLLGTFLVPLGVPLRRAAAPSRGRGRRDEEARDEPAVDVKAEMAALGEDEVEPEEAPSSETPASLSLPYARRDVDRLRLVLLAQRRLREVHQSPGVKHVLAGRGYFDDALRWLEIHGGVEGQELAAHWRSLDLGDVAPPPAATAESARSSADAPPRPSRRRRRRRRRRPDVPPPASP